MESIQVFSHVGIGVRQGCPLSALYFHGCKGSLAACPYLDDASSLRGVKLLY